MFDAFVFWEAVERNPWVGVLRIVLIRFWPISVSSPRPALLYESLVVWIVGWFPRTGMADITQGALVPFPYSLAITMMSIVTQF